MHSPIRISSVALLLLPQLLHAQQQQDYSLSGNWSGNVFFDQFNFMTGAYKGVQSFTHLQSRINASKLGMINYTAEGTVYLGADLSPTGADSTGRNSFRLESKGDFNEGLFIFDINHMPAGCGAWPALWLYGKDWPISGEIDIVENVNEGTSNLISLHTTDNCIMTPPVRDQLGNQTTNNCFINSTGIDPTTFQNQNYNQGCATTSSTKTQIGAGFNAAGGGMWALEWNAAGINIWFWQRGAPNWPADIVAGNPNPSSWGIPESNFTFNSCDHCHFYDLKMVLNLNFCGVFAAAPTVWGRTCAAKTANLNCSDFVLNNPGALAEAYFSINYFSIYQIPKAKAFDVCPAAVSPLYPATVISNAKDTLPNGNPVPGIKRVASTPKNNHGFASLEIGIGAVIVMLSSILALL